MSQAKWQLLLKAAIETKEYEIDCEECFEVLDMYAELLQENTDPAEIMPTVEQHLRQCNCCTGQLEALMVMLDQAISQADKSTGQ